MRESRNPNLMEAITGFALVIGVIIFTLRLKAGMQVPLMLGAMTAGCLAFYLGNSWNDIQDSIVKAIGNSALIIMILVFSGILVGVWISGGAVPTLIYYGVKLISPSFFLPLTFILACLSSLATGTSFGTIATIGIACLGIGDSLGMPTAMTVGAVVSGAFFGDKMSPISDTTNIAPAMAGADLFDHIASMLWTTVPAAIVSTGLYTFLGLKYANGSIDTAYINQILETLDGSFNISILTVIPLLLLLLLSMKKVPALLTLATVSIFSCLVAMVTQGVAFTALMKVAVSGYKGDTGLAIMDKILSRGGMNMMLSSIMLIIIAVSIGGILERARVLNVIVEAMLTKINTYTGLILSVIVASYAIVISTGNMVVGSMLVGRAFKPAFEDLDIHPKVLSRTLEDVNTLTNSIIPWGGACLFIQAVMGIDLSYIPYAFLNYLTPLFAVILAITGIGVWNRDGVSVKKIKQDTASSKSAA